MAQTTDDTNDKVVDVPAEEVVQSNPPPPPEEEWKNKYLRALADYQNLEKRTWAEKEEIRKYAAEVTLKKFLPSIDNLVQAANHSKDEGILLSLKSFQKSLAESGVKRIEVVGKPFDPQYMECIEVVSGEAGLVVEEISAGYLLYEKVLRVAKVKVGEGTSSFAKATEDRGKK